MMGEIDSEYSVASKDTDSFYLLGEKDQRAKQVDSYSRLSLLSPLSSPFSLYSHFISSLSFSLLFLLLD